MTGMRQRTEALTDSIIYESMTWVVRHQPPIGNVAS